MKEYRTWTPKQSFLLPPSPLDWLPQQHPVYFILDVVDQLDLSAINARLQEKDARGERPYSPRMMTALLLYAYCMGVFSSRKIARATHEDIAFRVLCNNEHPYFTTINQFRLDHLDALKALFLDVLKLCRNAGLVRLGHVSLDGSKFRANASKHKAMSYDRMLQDEKRLKAEIEALLKRAKTVDEEDDANLGDAEAEDDIPQELARREARLARIQEAKAELEAEAVRVRAEQLRESAASQRALSADESRPDRERKRFASRAANVETAARDLEARGKRDDDDSDPPAGGASVADWPRNQVPTKKDGTPEPHAQRNFTDPESRIMMSDGAFIQGYNSQIVVDDQHQVIIAAEVSNQASDPHHFGPILEIAIGNAGQPPERVSADAGYFSMANVDKSEALSIDAYISPGRERRTGAPVPVSAQPTRSAAARAKMREKLAAGVGRATYARRKCIVEPVFGQIKEARRFRRFSLRGLVKASAEWALVCATHNLLKLYRAHWLPSQANAPA